VILQEILKKINGTKAQYTCFLEEGRYRCMVTTIMMTNEEHTCGTFEEAFGNYSNTEEDAEEDAASCMIEKLKMEYKFEVDDTNFIKRGKNEFKVEELEEKNIIQKKTMKLLHKGWTMLLQDMENTQEVAENLCGRALAALPTNYVSGPNTDLIGYLCSLNESLERIIFESMDNMMSVSNT
jgi:hypothetical protein